MTSDTSFKALLEEALDLVPRIGEDDPMATALLDWCRRVRVALNAMSAKKQVKHVCGAYDFDTMRGHTCPACEIDNLRRSVEEGFPRRHGGA